MCSAACRHLCQTHLGGQAALRDGPLLRTAHPGTHIAHPPTCSFFSSSSSSSPAPANVCVRARPACPGFCLGLAHSGSSANRSVRLLRRCSRQGGGWQGGGSPLTRFTRPAAAAAAAGYTACRSNQPRPHHQQPQQPHIGRSSSETRGGPSSSIAASSSSAAATAAAAPPAPASCGPPAACWDGEPLIGASVCGRWALKRRRGAEKAAGRDSNRQVGGRGRGQGPGTPSSMFVLSDARAGSLTHSLCLHGGLLRMTPKAGPHCRPQLPCG